jgi:hypothetical protein
MSTFDDLKGRPKWGKIMHYNLAKLRIKVSFVETCPAVHRVLLPLETNVSLLENKLSGRIGYAYIPELEAQVIGSLEVSVVVHDEVDRDQFCNVGHVKTPRTNANNQFSVKVCHDS